MNQPPTPSPLRRLYDRFLAWMARPGGIWVLFGVAVAESSFFPIPPDLFLIALGMNAPKRSFFYALVCTLGSVAGGIAGYGLGFFLMDTVGHKILSLYGLEEKFLAVQELYRAYDAWAISVAGFTPLPYKLFTLTAGAFAIDFPTFCLASLLSRGARFFLIGALLYRFGAPARLFIERYFNLLTLLFVLLLAGGFLLLKL